MEKRKGLSGSALKLIAMGSMFIDHIGASVVERGVLPAVVRNSVATADVSALEAYERWHALDAVMRAVGRLAFPIFCFLLIEGFLHTRDWKKYFARLFAFSLISEVPFDFAFYGTWRYMGSQNVFFTLWIALLALACMRYAEQKEGIAPIARFAIEVVAVLACMATAHFLKTDYGAFGVLAIAILYYSRHNKKLQTLCGCCCFAWEVTAPLAFYPIYRYNGKRGLSLKYVFYAFYPIHLLALGLVANFCF